MIKYLSFALLVCACAAGAPKLRLSSNSVGPVFVAAGQNGNTQTLDAGNTGDGSLTLSVASSATWLTAAVGPTRNCTIAGTCQTINLAFNSSTLARGSYSGVVTVTSPGAVDAPQKINVTLQVGSAIPDTLDLYTAPGGTASINFTLAAPIIGSTANLGSGVQVSTTLLGLSGSSYPIVLNAKTAATTPVGDYPGTIVFSGSTQAADNKSVPITVHVTTQPVVSWAPGQVGFRIAQGAAAVTSGIGFSNSGGGTLSLTGITGAPTWLTTSIVGTAVVLTANPGSLSPGAYTATLTVATNARNGSASIPVEMDVLTPGAPTTSFGGVVDDALAAGDGVAQGGVASIYGEQLADGAPVSVTKYPLPTSLNGTTVYVNNQPAPLYYISANQVNFQMPYGVPAGTAVVRIDKNGQTGNSVSVTVGANLPRILLLGIGNYPNAPQADGTYPVPASYGPPFQPIKAGSYLVLYAFGMGPTSPAAVEGQPAPAAEPLARVPNVQVLLGQTSLPGSGGYVTPIFAGLTPYFSGVYQVNVQIPANAPKGDAVNLSLLVNGAVSNRVTIAIQ